MKICLILAYSEVRTWFQCARAHTHFRWPFLQVNQG